MTGVVVLMLVFLIACAIAVCVTRDLLTSVIIYMGYSMVMSIVWITLESPDLAITEAAVGAGVTSLLFFLTLKKIHAIDARNEVRRAHAARMEREEEERLAAVRAYDEQQERLEQERLDQERVAKEKLAWESEKRGGAGDEEGKA